jgi:hypothetical protein
MRKFRRGKKIRDFPVNEIDLTDPRVIKTTTRTRGTTGRASRGRDEAGDHGRGNTVLYFEAVKRENPRSALWVSRRDCVGFERFLERISAESAKRYRRFTCQRSSRGVATRATGASSGGMIGEDLHRYV